MARSEYSRLRSIAVKRIERLEKAGLAVPGIQLPKKSELKTPSALRRETERLQKFLSSGTTVKEIRESGKTLAPSRTGIAKPVTAQQLRRRESRARRREALQNLTPRQRGLVKGAATLGIRIATDDISAFVEYMQYRFGQMVDSQFYIYATYAEDFQTILKKKTIGAREVVADFARYQKDKGDLEQSVQGLSGYSEKHLLDLWSKYINDL